MTPTARRIIRPTITSWFNSASISVTTTEAFTALSSRGKRNSSKGACDFPPRLATKNNAHRATFNPWARCSHLFVGGHQRPHFKTISKTFVRWKALSLSAAPARRPVKVLGEGEGPETSRHDGEVFARSNGVARLLFGVCCVRDTQVCLEQC